MNIEDLLKQFGPSEIEAISKQIGSNPEQTKTAIGGAVPAILGAMTSNTKNNAGVNGLLGALDRDHDGSILDDITGFIGNYQSGSGEGILKHVLGSQTKAVEHSLSAKTNLNSSQISQLLKIAAPIIMGYLGKQKRNSSSEFNPQSLTSLLGTLTESSNKSSSLDLSDILNTVGGLSGTASSKGIGGLLGKLFGR